MLTDVIIYVNYYYRTSYYKNEIDFVLHIILRREVSTMVIINIG